MKKIITISAICTLVAISCYGQKTKYLTSSFEIIFSEATINDVNNSSANSILRFAPVFNAQSLLNIDMSEKFGIFTGLGYRNVGYIYGKYSTVLADTASVPIKKKFRTYNIAIPAGIKLGNMNGLFFFGGYEIEFPFVYKEKTFNTADEKTDKEVYWFSNRTESIQQSWFVGIQFPYGTSIKFKQYFTEFHNRNFEANGVKPYEGLNSKIWYISLTFNVFKGTKFVAGQKYE